MQSSCVSSSCIHNKQQIICQQVETYVPIYAIDNEYPEYLHQVPIKVHKDCQCQGNHKDSSSRNAKSVNKELFKRLANYDSIKHNLFPSNASAKLVDSSGNSSENDVNAFGHIIRNLQKAYGKATSKMKLHSNDTRKGNEVKDFKEKFYDATSLILIATKLLNYNNSYPDMKFETSTRLLEHGTTRNPYKGHDEEGEMVKGIMHTESNRNSLEGVLFNNDEQARSYWIFQRSNISNVIGPTTDHYEVNEKQILSSEVSQPKKNNITHYYRNENISKINSFGDTKDFSKNFNTNKMNLDDINLSLVTASTIFYSKYDYKNSSMEGLSTVDEDNLVTRSHDIVDDNRSTKANYSESENSTSYYHNYPNNTIDITFDYNISHDNGLDSTIAEKPEMYVTSTVKFNYSRNIDDDLNDTTDNLTTLNSQNSIIYENATNLGLETNENIKDLSLQGSTIAEKSEMYVTSTVKFNYSRNIDDDHNDTTDNLTTLNPQNSIIYENTTNLGLETNENIKDLSRSQYNIKDKLNINIKFSPGPEDHKDTVTSSGTDRNMKIFNYKNDGLDNDITKSNQNASGNNVEMAMTATSIGYNPTLLKLFTPNLETISSDINSTLIPMTAENEIDESKTDRVDQINKNFTDKWISSTYIYFSENRSESDPSMEEAENWTPKQEVVKITSEDITISLGTPNQALKDDEKTATDEYNDEITQSVHEINNAFTKNVIYTEDLHKPTIAKSTEESNDEGYNFNINDSHVEHRDVSTALNNLNKTVTTKDKDQMKNLMFNLGIKSKDISDELNSEYSVSIADIRTTTMADTSTTAETKTLMNVDIKKAYERNTNTSENVEITDKYEDTTSMKNNEVTEPTYGTTTTTKEKDIDYIEKIATTKHEDQIFETVTNNRSDNTDTSITTVNSDNTETFKKVTMPYFSEKNISSKYKAKSITFNYPDQSESSIYFEDNSTLNGSNATSEYFNKTESLKYVYNQNTIAKNSMKITATSTTHLDKNISLNFDKMATNVTEKNNKIDRNMPVIENITYKDSIRNSAATPRYIETVVEKYSNKEVSTENGDKAKIPNYLDSKENPGYFYTTEVSKFLDSETASTASAFELLEMEPTIAESSAAETSSTTATSDRLDTTATTLEYMDTTAAVQEYLDGAATQKYSDEQPAEKYLDKTTTRIYPDKTKAQEYSTEMTTQKFADKRNANEFLEKVVPREYSKGAFHNYSNSVISQEYSDNEETHKNSGSGITREYSDSIPTYEYSDSVVSQGYSDKSVASKNSNKSVTQTSNLFKILNYTDILKEINYSDTIRKMANDYKDTKMTTLFSATDGSIINEISTTNAPGIDYTEKDKLLSNFLHTDISPFYSTNINATEFADHMSSTDYINNTQINNDIVTSVYQKQISSSSSLDSMNLEKEKLPLPIFSSTEAIIKAKESNNPRNASETNTNLSQTQSTDAKDSVHSLYNNVNTKQFEMQQPKDVPIKNVEIKHSFSKNFTATSLDDTKSCSASFKEQCTSCCECCSGDSSDVNSLRVKKQVLSKDLESYVNNFDYRPETFSFIKSLILNTHKDELEFLLSKAENLLFLENEILKRKISLLESMLDEKKKTVEHYSEYNLHKSSHMRTAFSNVIDILLKPHFEPRTQTDINSLPEFLETALKNDLNVSFITYLIVENLFRRNIINCHNTKLQQLATVIATSHVMVQQSAYETDQLLKALERFLQSSNFEKLINYLQSIITDTELEYINPVDAKQISSYIDSTTKILSSYHRDLLMCKVNKLSEPHENITEVTRKQAYNSENTNKRTSTFNPVTNIIEKQVEETLDHTSHSPYDKNKNTSQKFTNSSIIFGNTEKISVVSERPISYINSSMSDSVNDYFSTEVMTELSLYKDERKEKEIEHNETTSITGNTHSSINTSQVTEMYNQTEPLFTSSIYGETTTPTTSYNQITDESATNISIATENLESFHDPETRSQSEIVEYTTMPTFYESSTTANDTYNDIDPSKGDETKYLTTDTFILSTDAQEMRLTTNMNISASVEDFVKDKSVVSEDITSFTSVTNGIASLTSASFNNTLIFDTSLRTEEVPFTIPEYKIDDSTITSGFIIPKEISTKAREDSVSGDEFNQEKLANTYPIEINIGSYNQTVSAKFNMTENYTTFTVNKYVTTEPNQISLEDDNALTTLNHNLKEINFPQDANNLTSLAPKREERIQLENPPAQFQPISIDINQVLKLIQNRELLKVGIRK